jgi:predicted dehydrogenase
VSSRPLPVAVIGCGRLGGYHARILRGHPLARLVAVVDVDGERAAALARETGAVALTRASDLPAELEAAVVAVPTAQHAEVAVPLLERGVAVLVEKPLAGDLAAADAILAAAERGGALLAVGHLERYQPGLRKVLELGLRPRFIECHRLAPFSFRSLDIGVVHDLMIHDLDLILHLMGSAVESFDAAGGAILTDSEDMASVRLVFENGGRANVTASRASLSPMRRFRLFSGESYVSLDFHKNYGLMVRKGPRWEEGRADLRRLSPEELGELAGRTDFVEKELLEVLELELSGEEQPLQAELDAFLRAARGEDALVVSGAEGRRALELAERIAARIRAQAW